jgi:hypothetical protein
MPAPRGNTNAKGHVGAGGRPAIYDNRIPGIIRTLRARGCTEHEIPEILDVSPRTLRDWKAQHVEVSAALDVGNETMIQIARRSLFERAAGYTYEAEKVFLYQGELIRAKTREHVPPDATAARSSNVYNPTFGKSAQRSKTSTPLALGSGWEIHGAARARGPGQVH